MIRYALSCRNDHAFESWFQSASAFDSLQASGMVACPDCGSAEVAKALMAPQVQPRGKADLAVPKTDREKALAALRKKVEDSFGIRRSVLRRRGAEDPRRRQPRPRDLGRGAA